MNIFELGTGEITEYEKTIICSAASFMHVHPNSISTDQWHDISCFLCVNNELLDKLLIAISEEQEFVYSHLKINDEVIDLSEHWLNYELFEALLNFYYIRDCLNQISRNKDKKDKDTLNANYNLYKSAIHNMIMMNSSSGTYECMCNQLFSRDHAPQSFESFYPQTYLKILEFYMFYDDYYTDCKDMLPALYRIFSYEIETHTNAMYLILVSQILKHSTFFDNSINSIACDLYDTLHFLLKDARVISVQTNRLFQELTKDFNERDKETDNTTRLQIQYGFDNYDTYCLRLDLSHKGIAWVHYNNNSPSGVKSCFFSKDEYKSIIRDKPSMDKCFINYGNKWFLKERRNCELNSHEEVEYEEIQKQQAHIEVLHNDYTENDVIKFLAQLNSFLYFFFPQNVDKDGESSKYCFNLDKLMSWYELYYFCITCSDFENSDKLANLIVSTATNYKIILHSEEKEYLSNDGIEFIIDLAYERCYRY